MVRADSFVESDAFIWSGYALGVIGAIAGIFAVWAYFRGKQAKTLDWTPIYLAPLLDMKPSQLSLTWDGIQIDSPVMCRMRFGNTGKTAIRDSDYLHPLKLSFGHAKIYSFSITDASDYGIAEPIDSFPHGPEVLLTLPTMNAGATFEIEAVIDGASAYPKVKVRIENETRPLRVFTGTEAVTEEPKAALLFRTAFAVAGVVTSVAFGAVTKQFSVFSSIATASIVAYTILSVSMFILLRGRYRREVRILKTRTLRMPPDSGGLISK